MTDTTAPLTMTAEQEAAYYAMADKRNAASIGECWNAIDALAEELDAERAAHRATTAALTDAKKQAMEWRLIAESAEYKLGEARKGTGRCDYIFDADNWEVTYEGAMVEELTEDADRDTILCVGRLHRLGDNWWAFIPLSWDEDGDIDDGEWCGFDTEAEAIAARDRKPDAANPGGR